MSSPGLQKALDLRRKETWLEWRVGIKSSTVVKQSQIYRLLEFSCELSR